MVRKLRNKEITKYLPGQINRQELKNAAGEFTLLSILSSANV